MGQVDDSRAVTCRALDPQHSAAVLASAGTGKTWLLAKRMLRVLLADDEADPGGLLAVTFTRKAAGEMRQRLLQYARELVLADDEALDRALAEMCIEPDAPTRHRARTVHARLLACPHPPRIATFHAFCQDLLARFPLEAGVPPGFDLLTNERELRQSAWERLLDSADTDVEVRDALEVLFEVHGRPMQVRALLYRFLDHRGDWWAWTDGESDPVAFAVSGAASRLGNPGDGDAVAPVLTGILEALIGRVATAVEVGDAKTAAGKLDALRDAHRRAAGGDDAALETAWQALVVQDSGEIWPHSTRFGMKKIAGRAGEEAAAELTSAWRDAATACEALRERVLAARLLRVNRAWFRAGAAMTAHYQAFKSLQRLLDFADLEWMTCRLLNAAEHAHWVQYKLDRRIEHLLVDEFQDTNPTQWRMLQPLLEEMGAGGDERQRSVFIVGDAKQSIYGFRRARPGLLLHAAGWIERAPALAARRDSLALSRRSSQPVMDVVNALFRNADDDAGEDDPRWPLTGFERHETALAGLPGAAEVWRFTERTDERARTGLRNPLREGRGEGINRHSEEAGAIARRIREMTAAGMPVRRDDGDAPVDYGDVVILLRKRNDAHVIEAALRRHGVPYATVTRGMLLERLEVRDLLALLEILIAPWNDLGLAQVLKSPLFACSDDDLLAIAASSPRRGGWYEALDALAATGARAGMTRAGALLSRWRERVDRVPVHDLVDQVFAEGDVVERFAAAAPAHQRGSVRANLERFLELALETDAGRYPSLPRFVERLQQARDAGDEEFDEAPAAAGERGRVRILTVHGAKGLEAPVVFLAQCRHSNVRRDDWPLLVDWPATEPRPGALLLAHRNRCPAVLRTMLDEWAAAEALEEANTLYVAVTRARQYLFISGTEPRRKYAGGWLPRIEAAWPRRAEDGTAAALVHRGVPAGVAPAAADTALPAPDPRFSRPLPGREPCIDGLRPDDEADDAGGATAAGEASDGVHRALLHGTLVHRALELLAGGGGRGQIHERLAVEAGIARDDPRLKAALDEAGTVADSPALGWIFERTGGAWSEVPVYASGTAYGVIDRLVFDDGGRIWVIDYKTHPRPSLRMQALIDRYRPQLARYRAAVSPLWPDRKIVTALLFTAEARLVEVES